MAFEGRSLRVSVMESVSTVLLVLLSLSLSTVTGDVFDKMLPFFIERFKTVRKVALPVSDNSFQESLYQIGSFYLPIDGKTEACRNHSQYVLDSFLNYDVWALRMIDAASKPPSGMLDGHVTDLGNFDQCLRVVEPGNLFRGQYCFVETDGLMTESTKNTITEISLYPSMNYGLSFSVCVPSSCSYEDVMAHINGTLSFLNGTALLVKNSCTTSLPEPLSIGDWAAITVIVFLLTLVVVSTIYDTKYETGKNPYITAFSLAANIPKMVDTSVSPGTITCLNGLRVVAFIWVLMGHTVLMKLAFPGIRPKMLFEKIGSLPFAPLENALLSVDIFFFMTGLLVTYCYLRYRQRGEKVNLIHFYLLRYMRMTPGLAFIVMITGTIGIRLTEGPLWKKYFGFLCGRCHDAWWATLLYINNYLAAELTCVPQSWYLAADFQMYAFSPLLLVPLHKKPKLGLTLIALFLTLTTALGVWNAHVLNLRAGGLVSLDRRTEKTIIKDYMLTHVRAATFIIGVAIGFIIFKIKEGHINLKFSRASLWVGWLTSIFSILVSIFSVTHFHQEDYVYNKWLEVTHIVFNRHVFILGLSWIVVVCALGHGGILDLFLSWKPLIPIARLTYSAFLIHFLLLIMFVMNSRAPDSFIATSMWLEFFGALWLSYLFAVVIYLLVECPCANIVKLVFQGEKKSKAAPKLSHAVNLFTNDTLFYKKNHAK